MLCLVNVTSEDDQPAALIQGIFIDEPSPLDAFQDVSCPEHGKCGFLSESFIELQRQAN